MRHAAGTMISAPLILICLDVCKRKEMGSHGVGGSGGDFKKEFLKGEEVKLIDKVGERNMGESPIGQ